MRLAASVVMLVCLASPGPAHAQIFGRTHRSAPLSWQTAYDNGYREGIKHGERDARARRDFAFEHENIYQRGDHGYHRQYGDREAYRQRFRAGYEAGYNAGYYGRNGTYERAVPRPTPSGSYPAPYPTYPSYPTSPNYPTYPNYPGSPYPTYPSYPSAPGSTAGAPYGYGGPSDTGFADGYEKGVEDARDGDRYDPLRHSRYRSAERGYDRRFGSRDAYKNMYRDGFRQGYERGYREARTYRTRDRGWLGWIF